jgi:hypothetical protein
MIKKLLSIILCVVFAPVSRYELKCIASHACMHFTATDQPATSDKKE